MLSPWPLVFQRTLGILALAAALGLLFGHTLAAILAAITVAALGILAWHLLHLYRLERWLNGDAEAKPPRPDSIWHHVYRQCCRLQRRNRKRKRKLNRMLNRFQEAATALPDGIVLLDNNDETIWFNTAAQKLLGLRSSQDLGQSITALVRHPSFVGFLAKRTYDASIEFPSPINTERMLSVRLTPYSNKQHLLSISDISRMHRLEQTRRDFVANVSHELRTPLTVVGGYLETLLDSGEDCARHWSQPLLRMQQQASRMHHLIEDLLMLSRLEIDSDPQHQRQLNIARMLCSIADDARALSGDQDHQIEIEADSRLHLYGNEKELRSAFSNLVFNAVRYSPGGAPINIRWYADERGAHLEVQDYGEGIAPHHIPRLTERFYRVDRSRQREKGGTGLGLAIVKHVMLRHRGQIRIASELGVGSTFTCDFPSEQIIIARKAVDASKAC